MLAYVNIFVLDFAPFAWQVTDPLYILFLEQLVWHMLISFYLKYEHYLSFFCTKKCLLCEKVHMFQIPQLHYKFTLLRRQNLKRFDINNFAFSPQRKRGQSLDVERDKG